MLYRLVSTSHGGNTRGGSAAAGTTEAMDGVEEIASPVGVLYMYGAVLVLMTPSASGTMLFSKVEAGVVTSGDCAKAFIVGRMGHRRVLLGRSGSGWLWSGL